MSIAAATRRASGMTAAVKHAFAERVRQGVRR